MTYIYYKRLIGCLITLAIILTLIHYSDLDLKFQALFFNFGTKKWLINNNELILKFVFYKLPKYLIVSYGIILIIWSIKLRLLKRNIELEKKLLFLIAVLILTPLTVALFKHYSPIICPIHIKEFGGDRYHISPLDIFKEGVFFSNNGKCFPAGHASGGFSLIALYFVMPSKLLKRYALCGSLTLGTIMGLYQMAKGMHYLSDTVATLTIAYLVSITMERLIINSASS